jgi:general secretion pathway protein A
MRLFTRDAVIAIHKHSKGIPRVISVICDNALVNGFAADQKPVGASIVAEVCRSLALTPEETHADLAAQPPVAPAPAAAAAPMFADVGRRRFSFF